MKLHFLGLRCRLRAERICSQPVTLSVCIPFKRYVTTYSHACRCAPKSLDAVLMDVVTFRMSIKSDIDNHDSNLFQIPATRGVDSEKAKYQQ